MSEGRGRPHENPTIVDVAERLGVSISTVSRAINDRSGISAATRARVQAAVEELGFTPRTSARRLVTRRSRTLSLLFPATSAHLDGHDLAFVLGAATATAERDYFLNLHTEEVTEDELADFFRAGTVDGLVVMQVLLRDPRVTLLVDRELPFVAIGRPERTDDLWFVDFDFEQSMELALGHLAELGHRTIGALGRPSGRDTEAVGSSARLATGVRRFAERLDLEVRLHDVELDAAAAEAACHSQLDEHPTTTAFVATSTSAATGALRAALHRGLTVPEDLSVVALSTDTAAERFVPSLTAVTFPSRELGHRATTMLIDRLEGAEVDDHQLLLPARLTTRASTAPLVRPPKGTA